MVIRPIRPDDENSSTVNNSRHARAIRHREQLINNPFGFGCGYSIS